MPDDAIYWSVTRYYLFFMAINVGLAYLVYRAWRDHIRSWRAELSRLRIALQLVASLLVLFASGVLLVLLFATYASWRTALNPDTPAPMFELLWIFAVFAIAAPAAFAGMLQTFVRKEYDQLMP